MICELYPNKAVTVTKRPIGTHKKEPDLFCSARKGWPGEMMSQWNSSGG